MQSDLLTGVLGSLLLAKAVLEIISLHGASAQRSSPMPVWFWTACGVSVGFAATARLLRSATGPAAALGGLICLHLLLRLQFGGSWTQTAMPCLVALFLATYGATRFGRPRKQALGLAERPSGRRASQVVANLGLAGLLAAGGTKGSPEAATMLAACIAALAEAAADTVSSEMGQALGGKTILIVSGRLVPPGTDGGVSLAGTACGLLTAALVVAVGPFAQDWKAALSIFAAASLGLLFDSLLGASVERRGWLGNDLVNFASTASAAVLAGLAVFS